ncbi:SAM-dependent methyltransferase [Streptomyces beihaiensis]|uniref:SAM-dependent methyltransferase n=1 Tax=Streptomyces beihaiensis TaxID=2984495 RepID=A0ABT3U1T7_9ACTN|nr:SAM-dependent methyltransferase [Streptomyces beihaiensis]MCX3063281.1 SAM-dependent methyltransferase [Streptomyces beihaiensis]
MSDDRAQQPDERIAAHIAHNARVWNYWLGGKDHYEVDEQVGDMVTSMYPSIREVARADRAFLGRAVTFLAQEAGIRQFLDIGTGLPTADNTHEVAQRIAPDARIVYVDNDPIVLTHARALLTSSFAGATHYVDADAHDPRAILEAARGTLDLDKPVAIMLLGILNFVLDTEKATAIVRSLVDGVASGSYVVLTHPTLELGGEGNEEAMKFWNENATPPITARTRAEVAAFLDGLEILEPGLVSCARWRTERGEEGPLVAQFGVVARKP